MNRIMFYIELVPPSSASMLKGYTDKICSIVPACRAFSIASKQSQAISGFEKCLSLVRLLRDSQIRELDIIFHVTCRDLNRGNIEARLKELRNLKIDKILVVTGDDYKPADNEPGRYANSLELLPDVVRCSRRWAKWIAVAGYPGGNGRQSHDNVGECERLSSRIEVGATAVLTQCVFDSECFNEFSRMMQERHRGIKIIPSVALFSSSAWLDKIIGLTRVNDSGSIYLGRHLRSLEDSHVETYCEEFSTKLCHDLKGYHSIVLCTFGRLDLAQSLIQRLNQFNCTTS